MPTPPYASLPVTEEELPAVMSLVNDRCPGLFMTGIFALTDTTPPCLQWGLRDTKNLLRYLESLNSARVEGGAAHSLIARIKNAFTR